MVYHTHHLHWIMAHTNLDYLIYVDTHSMIRKLSMDEASQDIWFKPPTIGIQQMCHLPTIHPKVPVTHKL